MPDGVEKQSPGGATPPAADGVQARSGRAAEGADAGAGEGVAMPPGGAATPWAGPNAVAVEWIGGVPGPMPDLSCPRGSGGVPGTTFRPNGVEKERPPVVTPSMPDLSCPTSMLTPKPAPSTPPTRHAAPVVDSGGVPGTTFRPDGVEKESPTPAAHGDRDGLGFRVQGLLHPTP